MQSIINWIMAHGLAIIAILSSLVAFLNELLGNIPMGPNSVGHAIIMALLNGANWIVGMLRYVLPSAPPAPPSGP